MTDEEEIWIVHYDVAKKHLKVDKLWSTIEEKNTQETRCVFTRLMTEVFT